MDENTLRWLLASETPSIRALALRHLAGRNKANHGLTLARRAIMDSGPVPAILRGQAEAGHWRHERGYYTPKYTSTHWSMLLLSELGADGQDARLEKGASHMLATTEKELRQALAGRQCGMSCFWGNLLRYVLHCGLASDARVDLVIQYLVEDGLAGRWSCHINGGLPCAWGAARALWGLAAIPPSSRGARVEDAIQSGVDFLLASQNLVGGSYPTPGPVHSLWSQLSFPLFYQADILFVLRVAAEVGALDHPGAQPGLHWLADQRKSSGRWRGSSPFRRRTWAELGDKDETDRWVTLWAASVLRQAG